MILETRMSLGYVKGRYWVPDEKFQRYAALPCYKALLKALLAAGVAIDVRYSYNARQYTADVQTIERFEKSQQNYIIHHNTASDPNPLGAMSKALRESELRTPRILACCLEVEMLLLVEVTSRMKDLERRVEDALDTLVKVLSHVRA